MSLYTKCIEKRYSFLVIDTSLGSDNSLRFRENLLGGMLELIKGIDNKIKDEKINTKLMEKQRKYWHYHLEKLVNKNILQAKKYYHLMKVSNRTS